MRLIDSLINLDVKEFSLEDDYGFDDPYAIMDEAEEVFKKCGIKPDRDKELSMVAIYDESVIGAVFSSYTVEECEVEYISFGFDIAVDPTMQRNGVGTALMNAAMRGAASLSEGDMPVLMRTRVVNRNMEKILDKLGFSDGDEERHGDGSCHMEKWL